MKLIDRCTSCKHLSPDKDNDKFEAKYFDCNNIDKIRCTSTHTTIKNPAEFGCIFWEEITK